MEKLDIQNPVSMFKDAFDFNNPGSYQIQNLIKSNYLQALKNKFAEFKQALLNSEPDLYERLILKEDQVNAESLETLLSLPEISHGILNHQVLGKNQLTEFVISAMDAIASKNNNNYDISSYNQLWIPDGSFFIKYDVKEKEFKTFDAFHLLDVVPIDFFSPYCLKISNSDVNEKPENKIEPYGFDEIETICRLFEETVDSVIKINGLVNQLTTFLKAIVINKISNNGRATNLVSGSDARYIGRTVISNVISADPVKLMEAFVHESIHSALYMGDIIKPWLPTREQTKLAGYNAVSPWTGNKISISSIQEAIFVWYGIYQLWKICYEERIFDSNQVVDRLMFVTKGFRDLNINSIAALNNFSISEDLSEAIAQMRKDVLREMHA